MDDAEKETSSSEYSLSHENDDPLLFDQANLDDQFRDLNLPEDSSELLASRLKARNLLLPGTKITAYRKTDEMFVHFFQKKTQLYTVRTFKGWLIYTNQVFTIQRTGVYLWILRRIV